MSKVFFHPDGTASPHPTNKDHAIRHRRERYDDGHRCMDCGDCSIKYVKNDRCIHCSRLAALALWQMGVAGRQPDETLPQYLADECLAGWEQYPMANSRGHAASPEQAERMGAPVWLRLDPCERAGHPGVRTLDDKCWFCERAKGYRSPRQDAIANGRSWYIPAEPCTTCGTFAQRHVTQGRCLGCNPPREPGRPKGDGTHPADQLPADMILSRKDARALGFTVYRTGYYCKYGHAGFRYVTTAACIDCIRGVDD